MRQEGPDTNSTLGEFAGARGRALCAAAASYTKRLLLALLVGGAEGRPFDTLYLLGGKGFRMGEVMLDDARYFLILPFVVVF